MLLMLVADCRSKTGVLSFEGVIDMSSQDWFRQLPLLVLVNMGAGFLGATFNALHKALFKVQITCNLSCLVCPMPCKHLLSL